MSMHYFFSTETFDLLAPFVCGVKRAPDTVKNRGRRLDCCDASILQSKGFSLLTTICFRSEGGSEYGRRDLGKTRKSRHIGPFQQWHQENRFIAFPLESEYVPQAKPTHPDLPGSFAFCRSRSHLSDTCIFKMASQNWSRIRALYCISNVRILLFNTHTIISSERLQDIHPHCTFFRSRGSTLSNNHVTRLRQNFA